MSNGCRPGTFSSNRASERPLPGHGRGQRGCDLVALATCAAWFELSEMDCITLARTVSDMSEGL